MAVLEHQKWHLRAFRFKNILEGMSPNTLEKGAFGA